MLQDYKTTVDELMEFAVAPPDVPQDHVAVPSPDPADSTKEIPSSPDDPFWEGCQSDEPDADSESTCSRERGFRAENEDFARMMMDADRLI